MFFTIGELFDILVMTCAVGYIFSDLASRFRQPKDVLLEFTKNTFSWENFKFSVYATVPAVLLHELAHKFLALAFGLQATFHAQYTWLAIGIALKLINFPFLFFVPAAVYISGSGTLLQHSLVAFAGPATNGLLWLVSYLLMRLRSMKKHYPLLYVTKTINMWLFFLNLIPIPPFDGYTFFSGLFQTIFH